MSDRLFVSEDEALASLLSRPLTERAELLGMRPARDPFGKPYHYLALSDDRGIVHKQEPHETDPWLWVAS